MSFIVFFSFKNQMDSNVQLIHFDESHVTSDVRLGLWVAAS